MAASTASSSSPDSAPVTSQHGPPPDDVLSRLFQLRRLSDALLHIIGQQPNSFALSFDSSQLPSYLARVDDAAKALQLQISEVESSHSLAQQSRQQDSAQTLQRVKSLGQQQQDAQERAFECEQKIKQLQQQHRKEISSLSAASKQAEAQVQTVRDDCAQQLEQLSARLQQVEKQHAEELHRLRGELEAQHQKEVNDWKKAFESHDKQLDTARKKAEATKNDYAIQLSTALATQQQQQQQQLEYEQAQQELQAALEAKIKLQDSERQEVEAALAVMSTKEQHANHQLLFVQQQLDSLQHQNQQHLQQICELNAALAAAKSQLAAAEHHFHSQQHDVGAVPVSPASSASHANIHSVSAASVSAAASAPVARRINFRVTSSPALARPINELGEDPTNNNNDHKIEQVKDRALNASAPAFVPVASVNNISSASVHNRPRHRNQRQQQMIRQAIKQIASAHDPSKFTGSHLEVMQQRADAVSSSLLDIVQQRAYGIRDPLLQLQLAQWVVFHYSDSIDRMLNHNRHLRKLVFDRIDSAAKRLCHQVLPHPAAVSRCPSPPLQHVLRRYQP